MKKLTILLLAVTALFFSCKTKTKSAAFVIDTTKINTHNYITDSPKFLISIDTTPRKWVSSGIEYFVAFDDKGNEVSYIDTNAIYHIYDSAELIKILTLQAFITDSLYQATIGNGKYYFKPLYGKKLRFAHEKKTLPK